MAEVTGFRHNALPYPIYAQPWAVTFPMLDADGDLVTGATTPDAEKSLNGDTFADCTNESVEIATASGVYYLLLTAAEMTADIVTVIAKSATAGMKTTVITLYPRKLVVLRAGTVGANAGDGTTLQLDSSASAVDDYYNGCILAGVLDSTNEVRVIGDYVGSTKVCTVSGPAFNLAPDTSDTFTVYLPEGRQITQADVVAWNATAVSTPATAGIPDVNVKNIDNDAASASGTVTFPNATLASTTNITAGTVTTATNVTTVNGLAANTITASAYAVGAIAADAFAAGAIDAAALAADAGTEIAAAVWDMDATGHQTGGTFGQAIGDPAANTATIYAGVVTNAAGVDVAADIIAIKAQTAAIEVDTAEIGTAGAGLTNINLPNQTMDIVGSITGSLSGSVGSVTGAVGSVTGLTASNLDATISSRMPTTHLAATAGKLDGVALADTVTTYTGNTKQTADVATLITTVGVAGAGLTAADDATLTQIALVKAKTDLIPGTQDGYTFAQHVILQSSALAGKSSGLATATAVYRSADDSKARITATVDADGNRTAITLDAT